MRHQESGIVDRVVLTTNEKGFRFCKGAPYHDVSITDR